jgi:hypothetical protein
MLSSSAAISSRPSTTSWSGRSAVARRTASDDPQLAELRLERRELRRRAAREVEPVEQLAVDGL